MTDREQHPIKTYRYLRIAMVSLVITLAAAVAHEMFEKNGDCFQTSISAYWYTPAQAIFVGTLIAIGVCMIALKGNTEWEDIFLNIAGMLAPVVALVPTPGSGKCATVLVDSAETRAAVENNITALFVVGVVGWLVALFFARKDRTPGSKSAYGLAVAAVLLVAGIVWFEKGFESFLDNAHYTAALTMFGFIVLVVVWNAWQYAVRLAPTPGRSGYANRYAAIAVLMVGSAVAMGGYAWVAGWDHAVLWIEGVLITLFATFWLVQTRELWGEGVREPAPAIEPMMTAESAAGEREA
jgi:hypothetical protein